MNVVILTSNILFHLQFDSKNVFITSDTWNECLHEEMKLFYNWKHHSFLKRANIPTRLKGKKRNFLLWLFFSFFHSIFTYEFFKNYERQITFRLFVSLRSRVTFRFINVLLLNYCFDHIYYFINVFLIRDFIFHLII